MCVTLLVGCSQQNNQRSAEHDMSGSAQKAPVEYIIVLTKNSRLNDAVDDIAQYDVSVIRDLKRDRYLIGLGNDPGIAALRKVLDGSQYITHIQPNYTYSTP